MGDIARRRGWGDCWVYDGQSTLFATRSDLMPYARFDETTSEAVECTSARPLRAAPRALPTLSMLRAGDRGQEEEFTVRLRGLGQLDVFAALQAFRTVPGTPLPAEALTVLDLVARQRRAMDPARWTTVGRSFLNRPDAGAAPSLGAGLEVWLGYNASARPWEGTGGALLSLVVDRAAAAFVKAQSAPALLQEVLYSAQLRWSPDDQRAWRKACKAIRGLKARRALLACARSGCSSDMRGWPRCAQVELRVGATRRQHRARGVTREPATRCFFQNEELGMRDSVAAYFARKLGAQRLAHPEWPCVDVSPRPSRPVLLPLELCHVLSGQRRQLLDDPAASAAMIRATAAHPDVRWRDIEAKVRAHVAGDATLAAFGVRVAPSMTALEGRVLDAPELEYAGGARAKPHDGAWSMRGMRLLRPAAPPAAWAAVCADADHLAALGGFLPHFERGVRDVAGFALPAARPVDAPRAGEALEDMLTRVLAAAPRPPATVFLLLVLDGAKETYERAKTFLDARGIVSQCMLPRHLGGSGAAGGGGRGGAGRGGGGGAGRGGGFAGRGGPASSGPSMQYSSHSGLYIYIVYTSHSHPAARGSALGARCSGCPRATSVAARGVRSREVLARCAIARTHHERRVTRQEKVELVRVRNDGVHHGAGQRVAGARVRLARVARVLWEQPRGGRFCTMTKVTRGAKLPSPSDANARCSAGSSSRSTIWNWPSLTPSRKKTMRCGRCRVVASNWRSSDAALACSSASVSTRGGCRFMRVA